MTLAREIDGIGDALVQAFHERRLAASLDYLLERLEAAAIRAAALEAACGAGSSPSHSATAGAVVIDFITRKERAR